MPAKYKYVVANGDVIFRGRTERSAMVKAEDYMLCLMPTSREEYEEEHGKVSDKKWIEVMSKNGFMITPAKLETD
jgi:hypothetical protein